MHPDGVYSSPDPDDREIVSWEHLEDMDNDDDNEAFEIPVYTHDGFLLSRLLPRFLNRTQPHGILPDLRVIKELFELPFEHDQGEDTSVNVYTYPQAGLKIAGHFQANGLMRCFLPFVQQVNNRLNSFTIDSADDDGLDRMSVPRSKTIVRGLACQGYNAVMHSTRGDSAQHHDAQLGMITGALAGFRAQGDAAKSKAKKLRQRCNRQLPHESFSEKIKNNKISRDLRLENIYCIDVEAIHPNAQDGGYVFHPL